MREVSADAIYRVPSSGANLTDLVHHNAADTPDRVSLARRVDGVWRDVTAKEFLGEITAVAKGLIAVGVQAGDRVAIMSRTRYEWSLVDFAIWEAGAVPVPIYETSSAEQVAWILADSGAVAVFAETAANVALIESVRDQAPELRHLWAIEPSALAPDGAVTTLTRMGWVIADDEVASRRATLHQSSVATIIYTSGTTGRPKGCMLTHANMLFEACNAVEYLAEIFRGDGHEQPSTLLFLPLAHVFARVIELGAIYSGSKLGHCADAKNIVAELGDFKPTYILSVPRVLEKVYNSAAQSAHSAGKGKIFDKAAETAIAWSKAYEAGRVPAPLALRHKLFDKLVYGKLRAALGGRAGYVISGGAPLGARLTHFFRGAGVFVCEGYGLTETAPAVAVNPYPNAKAGTVGRPLPGTTIRIAEDGEIEIKAPQVFAGYWGNEAATRAVFTEDGFFRTGDLGELDDVGYLSITGRKKEILVTAGGKNVAPAVLEDLLNAHALINQSMVVGDGKPFIAALVTLDAEALPAWLKQHGKDPDMGMDNAVADPDVLAAVETAVAEANKAVSKAESIRKFALLPAEWTIEGGQITPSLKVKRNVIAAQFATEIDRLYAG